MSLKKLHILVISLFIAYITSYAQQNLVTYAGKTSGVQFKSILQLSDSTYLVGGQANDLNWLPGGVTPVTLTVPNAVGTTGPINSASTTVAFILQLSSDMKTIKSVVRFPSTTVRDVYKIKTNTAPGNTTGDIYISGSIDPSSGLPSSDGYYLGRLNNNFLKGIPTGLSYINQVYGAQRNSIPNALAWPTGAESAVKQLQPWDVMTNGTIVLMTGEDFSVDWAELDYLGYSGNDTIMNNWFRHVTASGGSWIGTPASSYINTSGNPQQNLASTSVSYKYNNSGSGRGGDLTRSYIQSSHDTLMADENGNPGRLGARPEDGFYPQAMFFQLGNGNVGGVGPGYLGTSVVRSANGGGTIRLVDIVVDKRNNDFYLGFSIETSSPNNIAGEQDTETALWGMTSTGQLKWWARMHKETTNNSPIQQHIDRVAIDYKNNKLVVVGRCRGNVTDNFWKGNELILNPGGNGFQNQLTGNITNSDQAADFSWIGKYDLTTGKIKYATYLAEPDASNVPASASSDPNLDGFAGLNSGNINLVQTRVSSLSVHPLTGEVYVAGTADISDNTNLTTSARSISTKSAYQKTYKALSLSAGGGAGVNSAFVRVFDSTLSTVKYSTMIGGLYDPVTGIGGANTILNAIYPGSKGPIVVGYKQATGQEVQTINVLPWGDTTAKTLSKALLANIDFNCTNVPGQPDSIHTTGKQCVASTQVYTVAPVSNALFYNWVISGTGWSIDSTTTKGNAVHVTLTGLSTGGTLRVYAVNTCGVSLASVIILPSSSARPGTPGQITGIKTLCQGNTQTFRLASPGTGVTGYLWHLTGTYSGWALQGSNTADSVVITASSTATGNPGLRVVSINACSTPDSSAAASTTSLTLGTAPNVPTSSSANPVVQCLGTSLSYSVNAVSNASYYTWTAPTGWSVSSIITTSTSNQVTSIQATGGNLLVTATNSCGTSLPDTIKLSTPVVGSIPATPTGITPPSGGQATGQVGLYKVADVTGATSYTWTLTNGYANFWSLPGNASTVTVTGADTVSVLASPLQGKSMTLTVTANNFCGSSNPASISTFSGTIPTTPTFSYNPNSTNVCIGETVTFTVNPIPGVTSYNWNLPVGWTGTPSGNILVATVVGIGGGGVSVTPVVNSGVQKMTSAITNFTVSGLLTKSLTVTKFKDTLAHCPGVTLIYSVSGGSGTPYNWVLPAGWTLQDASHLVPHYDTVTITASASSVNGTAYVYSNTGCTYGTYNLVVGGISNPGAISGLTNYCQIGTPVADNTYKISKILGASSYIWQLSPASAGKIYPKSNVTDTSNYLNVTDTAVAIKWNQNFRGKVTLSVTARNFCYETPAQTLSFSFFPDKTLSAGSPRTLNLCPTATYNLNLNNPTPRTGGTWGSLGITPGDSILTMSKVAGRTSFKVGYGLPSCPSAVADSITVNVLPTPTFDTTNLSITKSNCGTPTGSINGIVVSGGNTSDKKYYELRLGGVTGPIKYSDSTSTAPSITVAATGLAQGTYYLIARINNTCPTFFRSYFVDANTKPVAVTVTPTKTVCQTDTSSLFASGLSGTTIQWYKDALLTQLLTSVQSGTTSRLNVSSDSVKVRTYYVVQSAGGCQSSPVSIVYTVNGQADTAGIAAVISNDTCGQNKGKIIYNAPLIKGATGSLQYSWNSGVATSSDTLKGLTTSVNTLQITLNGICPVNKTFLVTNISKNGRKPVLVASPASICVGSTATISTVTPQKSYVWTKPKGLDTTTVTGNLVVSDTGTYTLGGLDAIGCLINSDSLGTVSLKGKPSGSAISISSPGGTICGQGNDSLKLTVSITGNFTWQLPDNSVQTVSNSNSFYAKLAGTYTIINGTDPNGCFVSNKPSVSILKSATPPKPTISSSSSAFCITDDSISVFSLVSSSGYIWKLQGSTQTFKNDSVIHVLEAGNFQLSIINAKGCESPFSDSIVIVKKPNADLSSIQRTYYGCPGAFTTLNGPTNFPGASIVWYDSTTGNQLSTTTNYTSATLGNYKLVVTPVNGCPTGIYLVVDRLEQCKPIPNVITPNGDTKNDVFDLSQALSWTSVKLEISNRWGRSVYSNSSYSNDFGGSDLPDGIYFFTATNNTTGEFMKGWLQIIK